AVLGWLAAAGDARAQGTFDRPQKLPGGGEQYEYDTPLGRMRVTKTPIKEEKRQTNDSNAGAMMGKTGDVAMVPILGVAGLALLGGLGWLLMSWSNNRARKSGPDLGGWKPSYGPSL